jgi:hypothetical protein
VCSHRLTIQGEEKKMAQVIKTSFAGINVFWSSGEADHTLLETNLKAAGFSQFTFNRKSEGTALRDALQKIFSRSHRRLIRPLGPGVAGYGIYKEEVSKDGETLNHVEIIRVKVSGGSLVFAGDRFEGLPEDKRSSIIQMISNIFTLEKGKVSDSQITRLLVRALESLQGVSLRPRGGIYWLNQGSVEKWIAFVSAVEASATEESSIEVYRQNVAMDDDAIRAVSAALTHEINKTVEDLQAEVVSGSAGKRRLQTLGREATGLHDKIREYETLFGIALKSLHDAADGAACSAAYAVVQMQAQEGV